jgi:hypothetical protein
MAEEVQLTSAGATAKIRNPLGVVGLALITIGIYFFVWWYFINREMHDLGRERGTDLGQNPTNSVLAITLGAPIIVPAIVTEWTTSMRVEQAQEAVGIERRVSGPVLFLLLLLVGPVGVWYAQSELNKVWEAHRSGGAPAPALGTPQPSAQPAPPTQPASTEEQSTPTPTPQPPAQEGPESPGQRPEGPRPA